MEEAAQQQTNRLAHTTDLLEAWISEYDADGHHRHLSPLHRYALRQHLCNLHDILGALIDDLPEHLPFLN